MENLTALPGDNAISVPLDPMKADLVLPDNIDPVTNKISGDLNLPDMESPLKAVHQGVADIDPVITAQKIELAKKLNEPELFVDKNFEQLKKISQTPDDGYWKNLEKNFPESAKFLKEPRNMAVAKEDIENLTKTEKVLQDKSFSSKLWDGLQSGLAMSNAQVARIPSLAYNLAALPQNLIAKGLGHPEMQVSTPEALLNNPMANYYDKQQAAYTSNDSSESISDQISNGDYRNAAKNLAIQVVSNSPSQMISIMMGLSGAGLIPSLLVTGGMQGAGTLKESIDKGADPASATLNAAYQGTFEAGMESLSFGTIGGFKALRESMAKAFGEESAKKVMLEFGKEVAHSMASEGKEEFLTQLAQDFSAYATGVDPNAMKGTVGRAVDAGLVGAASGGLMTSPTAMLAGGHRIADVRKTENLKKGYSEFGKLVTENKFKENISDIHESLMADMAKGTPVENIYIDQGDFTKYFQSKNIDPNAIGKELGIENEVKDAIQSGGEIKIPLAKWASKLAGTEHYEGLKNDIKYSPESYSSNQNASFNDEITNQLMAEDNHAKETAAKSEELKVKRDQITQEIKTELINRGQDGKLAEDNARVFAHGAIAQSAMQGISVEEWMQKNKPTIVNGDEQVPLKFERKAIPQFNSDSIVHEDQVKQTIKDLGLPEIYQHPESISAIREQLAFMNDEVNKAEAGKRSGFQDVVNPGQGTENINTSTKSSFPQWFRDGEYKTKKDFNKLVSQGNSKNLGKLIQQAITSLKEGHGDNVQNALAPNLDFVSLVDPGSMESSFQASQKMAQRKNGEFFQTDKEIRTYLDGKVKGKAVLVTRNSEAPAAEFDKLTGQLTINVDKASTPGQVDQILSQFGEAKRESVAGKITANIDGDTHELDARKMVNALAAKLYNLQRLAECSRG